MVHVMEASQEEALIALWVKTFGDDANFAKKALAEFAGHENVFVAQEGDAVVSMLLAVPVSIKGKQGAYFYGLATDEAARGKGHMKALMDYAADALRAKGCQFIVLIPAQESLFSYYEKNGFEKAFDLRTINRPIRRNIWSQAEFDSVTAKKLLELRLRFCPDSVQLPLKQMMVVLGNLYAQGMTLASSRYGYGLYIRKGTTLHFLEVQAENDLDAEHLFEAAREREVFAENVVVSVGANQTLFLGQGTRQDYGMIRFLGEPFDVFEGYMRLMLDTEM